MFPSGNIPRDKDKLVSLFASGWRVVRKVDDSILGGIILELRENLVIILVLARLGDRDGLVACGSFVDDKVEVASLFDRVKGLLAFRLDCCKSACHDDGWGILSLKVCLEGEVKSGGEEEGESERELLAATLLHGYMDAGKPD